MKQTDIKRLEKVVEHYRKIEELLDKAYESIDRGKTEYVRIGDNEVSTLRLIGAMINDACFTRVFIEGKLKLFKEQLT